MMNEPICELEARMKRLERSNRLLVICCIALASAPLLIAAGGQGGGQPRVQLPAGTQLAPPLQLPPSAQKYFSKQIQDMLAADRQIHNVLRARVFALVDRSGATKAYLSTDETGDPMLTMYGVRNGGRSTALSMSIGLNANQPECVLYGYDDKPRTALYASGVGRDRLPQLLLADGGEITMKHSNGNILMDLMSRNDVAQWKVNDKGGLNILSFTSNGATPASRISEFVLTASETGNTNRLFAGPRMVSMSVNSKGTFYHAMMSAEGNMGLIRARCPEGPRDQVFQSKWRDPLHDVHSWQIDKTDPW